MILFNNFQRFSKILAKYPKFQQGQYSITAIQFLTKIANDKKDNK